MSLPSPPAKAQPPAPILPASSRIKPAASAIPSAAGSAPWLVRVARTLGHLLIATLLCLTALGAVVVVGWMDRSLGGRGWASWLTGEPDSRGWRRLFGGLLANVKGGGTAVLTSFAFTWPGLIPIALAWLLGWEISFNKIYEAAGTGPLITLAALPVAVLGLIWLPVARGRQALTGRWQEGFRLGVHRIVLAQASGRFLLVALAQAGLGVAFVLLTLHRYWFPETVPPQVPMDQVVDLYRWTLVPWTALWVALWLGIRVLSVSATRVGLARAVAVGHLEAQHLHPAEQPALDLNTPSSGPRGRALRQRLAQMLLWPVYGVLIVSGWLFAQAVVYQPLTWLVHPALHLPWLLRL